MLWLLQNRFDFDVGVVGDYLFADVILRGVWLTIQLSVLSQAIGIGLGLIAALMKTTRSVALNAIANFYIWFFRGTPLLVQLIFWFTALPRLVAYDWAVLSPFQAALLGLSINEGAYMAEIVRAGIQSVESGQVDAAKSLGMTNLMAMRRVVLPQAVRVIIPPTGNEFIAMLKNSSLASVIALQELLGASRAVYARNFRTQELLVVASIWYLAMTTVFSLAQARLEMWLNPEAGRGEGLFGRALRALGENIRLPQTR
jgi:polar amino acid transport system permease protein